MGFDWEIYYNNLFCVSFFRYLFNDFERTFPREKRGVVLNFDNFPDSRSTDWILDILRNFSAPATFFCDDWKASKSGYWNNAFPKLQVCFENRDILLLHDF
jgi:peptidoglycan/xylan/chitin deacetylase (PgdA/CDA1 family)